MRLGPATSSINLAPLLDDDGSTAGSSPSSRNPSDTSSRLPAEYLAAIELVRKRQDKTLLVQALSELGDVYAHFARWKEAAVAWGDALDTLLGPYQVLGCWRAELAARSGDALLRSYGAHGLLLAASLLGKLARWACALCTCCRCTCVAHLHTFSHCFFLGICAALSAAIA
jgi:hypothetical protein